MGKKLLISFLVSIFILSSTSNSIALNKEFKPFNAKPLSYSYDALEPYIDKETMILHYNKHYKTYLEKLNNEIKKYPEFYNYSVNDLLKNLDALPKDSATIIKNNAGGVSNHEIFFDIMTGKETKMNEKLESLINRDFGSFDNFKNEFKKAALSVFGSGWAWLVSDSSGKLSIITTANQDSPISLNLNPIIGLDVWEHAYYLQYQNKRDNYIENWFNVVNWNKALENYNNPINK